MNDHGYQPYQNSIPARLLPFAHNNSPNNMYVQSATLNGNPLNRAWLQHAEVAASKLPDGGQTRLYGDEQTVYGKCCLIRGDI